MSKDNVTTLRPSHSEKSTNKITLQKVIDAMNQWRSQKKTRSEKIPYTIWDMIFILLEDVPKETVLKALKIDNNQFQAKISERQKYSKNHQDTTSDDIDDFDFCEADTKFPLAYKPAKAFSTKTCVVELYRPDGMLMKIHMCTDRFDELLEAFYKG